MNGGTFCDVLTVHVSDVNLKCSSQIFLRKCLYKICMLAVGFLTKFRNLRCSGVYMRRQVRVTDSAYNSYRTKPRTKGDVIEWLVI